MQNKSLYDKLKSDLTHKFQKLFYNPYGKLGISWLDKRLLKYKKNNVEKNIKLLDGQFYFYGTEELFHGIHEIFVDEIYKLNLTSPKYIIDCGSNIGLSILYLKKQFPECKVIGFEPDSNNFSLLQKNVNSYQLKDVELHKSAVWTENTKLNFANEGTMSSSISTESDKNTIMVDAVRLKDFMDRNIDFLKIDIEGAEYQVLKDIQDKLHLVENAFIEYHGSFRQNNELTEIFNIIQSAGFHYYIKEAAPIYDTPFDRSINRKANFDVQLNIFCFR